MSEANNTSQEQEKMEESLLSSIIKSTFDFWQSVMQEVIYANNADNIQSNAKKNSLWPNPFTSIKEMSETIHNTMIESGLMEKMPQVMNTALEMAMKMSQDWTENMNYFVHESISAMEKSTSEHSQHQPESSLEGILGLYFQSMQKILNMPKLGMNRYYQERMNQAIDKLNLFTIEINEFSLLLIQPVKNSIDKMQQSLKEMAEGDGYFENAKEYYSMWIKILEGDYMNLLQSQEFVKAFHDVINKYLEFYAIYEEVLQDWLQFFPVTTKKDMEAVYKENYFLKKEIKAMSRRINDLESKVK